MSAGPAPIPDESRGRVNPDARENVFRLTNCRRPHEFKQRNGPNDDPYNCMECVRCGGRVSLEWAYGYRHGLADGTAGREFAHHLKR